MQNIENVSKEKAGHINYFLTHNISRHKDNDAHDDGTQPVETNGSIALSVYKRKQDVIIELFLKIPYPKYYTHFCGCILASRGF